MRILLVNSERGFRGGEFQTAALAKGLVERGIETHIAAARGSELARRMEGLMPVHRFRFERIPIKTPFGLRRLVGHAGVDLVHAQTSGAHSHVRIALIGLDDAPPLVVSRRVAFHTSGGLAGRLKYRSGVTRFIPISEAAARSLRNAGVPDDRMTIIPSGVDVSLLRGATGDRRLLGEWGVGEGSAVVGTVAALESEKGLDVLVEAAGLVMRSQDDSLFVILGEGKERRRLERLIADAGLVGRVVLGGPAERLERALPLFTIFVLPSLEEGMSTSLAAAMAAGRPVVATKTGGIPEVVGERAALLVPPGDSSALAEAISRLLDDPIERERLSVAGSERGRMFDIERTIESTIALYRSLLRA